MLQRGHPQDRLCVYVDQGRTVVLCIFRVLESGGLEIRSVSMSRPSLDDVFLRRTSRWLRHEAA
jgi:ABC-2 type transport system ATP-binding protein